MASVPRISLSWIAERKNELIRLADTCELLVGENETLRGKLAAAEAEVAQLREMNAQLEDTVWAVEQAAHRALPSSSERSESIKRETDESEMFAIPPVVDEPQVVDEMLGEEFNDASANIASETDPTSALSFPSSPSTSLASFLFPTTAGSPPDQSDPDSSLCAPIRSKKQHNCNECGKSFGSSSDLRRHAMLMHPKRGEPKAYKHTCEVCGKAFLYQVAVRQHMVVHTGERPFGCGFCGKAYSQKGTLDRHLVRSKCAEARAQNGC